jgi:hypothetical protein
LVRSANDGVRSKITIFCELIYLPTHYRVESMQHCLWTITLRCFILPCVGFPCGCGLLRYIWIICIVLL